MEVAISYHEMLKRHPEDVNNIIDKLRKSNSIYKFYAPEAFEWSYVFGIEIDMLTWDEITGKYISEHKREFKIRNIWIRAKKGKWYMNGVNMIKDIPEEVMAELVMQKLLEN